MLWVAYLSRTVQTLALCTVINIERVYFVTTVGLGLAAGGFAIIQNHSVPFLTARPYVPASHGKSSGLRHGLRADVIVWVSIIVVRTSLWPSICWIWRMSSCACNRCVANVCRRLCGNTRLGMPAWRAAALIAR